MGPHAPYRAYNYTVEFEDEIALDLFVQERGYRRVNERERGGVVKLTYVCKEFWQKDIKCSHKLSVTRKDGVITAKGTDGGRPHDHRRKPVAVLNFDETDIQNGTQSSSAEPDKVETQLHEIIKHATPQLLTRLKDSYQRKKREQEKAALRLFTQMSADKQKELLATYGCFDD